MIGVLLFCVGMAYFLSMILVEELSIFLRGALRDAREGLFERDTDVFPDECIHPFPNHITLP